MDVVQEGSLSSSQRSYTSGEAERESAAALVYSTAGEPPRSIFASERPQKFIHVRLASIRARMVDHAKFELRFCKTLRSGANFSRR